MLEVAGVAPIVAELDVSGNHTNAHLALVDAYTRILPGRTKVFARGNGRKAPVDPVPVRLISVSNMPRSGLRWFARITCSVEYENHQQSTDTPWLQCRDSRSSSLDLHFGQPDVLEGVTHPLPTTTPSCSWRGLQSIGFHVCGFTLF